MRHSGYPQPLNVTGTQAVLDRGTVLLSYSVSKDQTFLFVIRPAERLVANAPAVAVFTVPTGAAALQEQVTAFRNNVLQLGAASSSGSASTSTLIEQGQRLFAALITPALAFVSAADRVLISPDGPLHSLPFSALIETPSNPSRGAKPRYLIESKPLHTVVSATVDAQVKKARRASATGAERVLTAFGDPQDSKFDRSETVHADCQPGIARDGPAWVNDSEPSRQRPAKKWMRSPPCMPAERQPTWGPRPLKSARRRSARTSADVHFATHGLLDERFPAQLRSRAHDSQTAGRR